MPDPHPTTSAREPAFNLPGIILCCVAGLIVIHAIRSFLLAPEIDLRLVLELAVVPARWSVALDSESAGRIVEEAAAGLSGPQAGAREALARYVLAEGEPKPWTALSYAVLHGSWSHVILNSVWLAVFGTPVAFRCGAARFLVIVGVSAVAGAATHAALNAWSVLPMIGASAGVSGLTAAAATFMFGGDRWPRSASTPAIEARQRRRQSVRELLANRSAAAFIAVWFGTNLLFGLAAQPLGIVDSGIAWEAHLGGFIAGLLVFPRLDQPRAS